MELRSALSLFGVSEPDLEWRGLQMIVTWVLEWPLALGLIVTGMAIAFGGGLIGGLIEVLIESFTVDDPSRPKR